MRKVLMLASALCLTTTVASAQELRDECLSAAIRAVPMMAPLVGSAPLQGAQRDYAVEVVARNWRNSIGRAGCWTFLQLSLAEARTVLEELVAATVGSP